MNCDGLNTCAAVVVVVPFRRDVVLLFFLVVFLLFVLLLLFAAVFFVFVLLFFFAEGLPDFFPDDFFVFFFLDELFLEELFFDDVLDLLLPESAFALLSDDSFFTESALVFSDVSVDLSFSAFGDLSFAMTLPLVD